MPLPRFRNGNTDIRTAQNVEMASLTQNGSSFGQQPANASTLFQEVDGISRDIDEVEGQLKLLKEKQKQMLLDTGRNASQDLEAMNGQIMSELRTLTNQLRKMKSVHGNNQVQIKRIERRLKDVSGQYQNIESDFRRALRENMERQYRIVRPDATPEEVEQHIENPDTQVFAQALMQGNRMGNAQSVRQAVTARHEAIQKIESQMIELSQLFQQMNELVEEQEVAIANIEQKAEVVVEDLDKGNGQIVVAIESAKARNRKKWWCLAIGGMYFLILAIFSQANQNIVLIIIIIAIIIVVIKAVNGGFSSSKSSNSNKRDIFNLEKFPVISSEAQSKLVIPGKGWSEDNVVPGAPFVESKAVVPGAQFKGGNVVPGTPFSESKPVDIGAKFNEVEARREGGKFRGMKRDAMVGGIFRGPASNAVKPGVPFTNKRVAFKPPQ